MRIDAHDVISRENDIFSKVVPLMKTTSWREKKTTSKVSVVEDNVRDALN